MISLTKICFSSVLFTWGTVALSAAVVNVPVGGDLQHAIDNANPGDTIVLPAGAVFRGNFVLPNKGTSTAYITIQSSLSSSLPAGQRVSPSNANLMSAVVSPNGSAAISVSDYAHHYQLIGLEIRPPSGTYATDLVTFGSGTTTSIAALPHDLILDRSYIHGDPAAGSKRGISLNCGTATIENSYISDIKSTWQDASAIGEWNGGGPFTIVNNYLEASGENILFGGSAPYISGLVPSGIVVQGNYLSKPLSWRPGSSTYAGVAWSVKNIFEIKSAKNVTVTGNVMENNWVSSQDGFGVLFTVRTESGTDPTATVQNVIFEKNLVRNTAQGVNMEGIDSDGGGGSTSNVTIRNNVFLINGAAWGSGTGTAFQILNGMTNLTIDHNTVLQDGNLAMAAVGPSSGFVFQNNLALTGPYGFFGSGYGTGTAALRQYFPGAIFQNNAIVGGYALSYPAGNFFPSTTAAVGFANFLSGNYALATASPYATAATDGTAVGAAIDTLQPLFTAALAGTASTGSTSSAPVTTPTQPTQPTQPPTTPTTFSPIFINAGGSTYTDTTGQTWSADTDFVGGASWASGNTISGTTAPGLYQTCRYGSSFSYQVPAPNGSYSVTLKFAEVSRFAPGQRIFNVAINGTPVLTNFDIFAAAGKAFAAVDRTFPVTVTGGQIVISFTTGNDWPIVSGIQVSSTTAASAPTGSTVRINSGGATYTDSQGQSWSGDTSYTGGFPWAVSNAIGNTSDAALFQTCRYGPSFGYTIPVANGNYTVNLKFAEISRTAVGQRTFNVAINGAQILTNFDVIAAAGGEFLPITESFPVTVSNGQVTVQLTAATDWALISGIEILPR